jgi:hypothetical protein
LAVTFLLSLAAGVLAKAVILADGAGMAPKAETAPPPTALCAALASVDRGQEQKVVVSGIYTVGYEDQRLYDPDQLRCAEDVAPATWIEFAPGGVDATQLSKLIRDDRRAYVTFEGTLFGPPPLGPDSPKAHAAMSAALRMRGGRYGHMSGYRTQMVVTRVLAAGRVPKETPWGGEWSPQELAQRRLQLQRADLPTYPYSARLAGLEGEVEVEVTLKDGKVAATRVITGDRALAAAAVANIETWTFAADVSETFTTRFIYALDRRFGPMHSQKAELELDLPFSVRITAPRNGW